MKAREDPIDVGEEVLVLLPEDSTGVSAKWHGPYIVQEKPSALSYKIATPNRGRKTRQFHQALHPTCGGDASDVGRRGRR